MSDTGAQEYVEDVDIDEINEDNVEEDEEARARQFFGDDEYTLLSHIQEEEEEKDLMSMTMQ